MRYSTNKKLAFLIQVFYLAVWVLLAYLAWKAAGLIWPFLAALVLVGCIHPLVRFLHRKMKLNQKVLSVTFLVLLSCLSFPSFSSQCLGSCRRRKPTTVS